jgi:hypothetical protein
LPVAREDRRQEGDWRCLISISIHVSYRPRQMIAIFGVSFLEIFTNLSLSVFTLRAHLFCFHS